MRLLGTISLCGDDYTWHRPDPEHRDISTANPCSDHSINPNPCLDLDQRSYTNRGTSSYGDTSSNRHIAGCVTIFYRSACPKRNTRHNARTHEHHNVR